MTPMIRMRMANKARGEGIRAQDNTLWLYDAIASTDEEAEWWGGVSPSQFINALKGTTGPVTLRINSPGGSVFGAQAMVAAMREHAAPITARVDSLAASAASVIAVEAAALEMVPGSRLMIHKAWGVAVGNTNDLTAYAALLASVDDQIAQTYAARAKKDRARYDEFMAAETWFTAEQAAAEGLADRVVKENLQRPSNRWDLSAYARPPALPAPPPEQPQSLAPQSLAAEPDLRAQRLRQLAARLVAA